MIPFGKLIYIENIKILILNVKIEEVNPYINQYYYSKDFEKNPISDLGSRNIKVETEEETDEIY
ncbi:hypothetical protein DI243_09090 [Paenibacillus polymyxa]|nr:hypothetical protein RE92_02880 [Paenibacillus polymyxa]QOH61551.1 hypothetical protein DI243_09090 [Paenibacillus polymyxa]